MSCDKGSKHVLITHNGSFTKRVKCERPTACSEGTCLGPTHLHLSRRADYALVQTQLASRKGDLPLEPIVEDAARHRPMYGAHYGSNYITRQNDGPSFGPPFLPLPASWAHPVTAFLSGREPATPATRRAPRPRRTAGACLGRSGVVASWNGCTCSAYGFVRLLLISSYQGI